MLTVGTGYLIFHKKISKLNANTIYFLYVDDIEYESYSNGTVYCINLLNRETNSIWSTLTADAFPLINETYCITVLLNVLVSN